MTADHTGTAPALDSSGIRLYDQADELRAAAPATRVSLPSGLTAWSVTRGSIAKRLLTDPRVSRNPRRHWPGFTEAGQPGWMTPWTPASMLNADGEDHTRLRKLISRAFSPRRLEALRPAITDITTALLDGLDRQPPGDLTDLRTAYSYRIPITVICDLMGVPLAERPRMQRVMDGAMDTGAAPEDAAANSAEMIKALRDHITYKKTRPGPDMATQLLHIHEEDGDRLSDAELLATFILLVGAGSETTVSLLDHTTVSLLSSPQQLAAVRSNPALWDDAIEESLRLNPPIMHMPMRYAAEDIDLDGVTIRRGDLILIAFGAHGRDPAIHHNREAFQLDRQDKSHLAFGFGAHYCMGAPLARLEAAVALPALFDRYPNLTLAAAPDDLPRVASFIGNDYASVPVYLHGR
ncbi:cytochrome P450 [Streptomyces solisilvae]|uniref:cytochrome P450 family protein n=1 Tax=Streptomyces malaysiensis TaxID=92644 RepID=UPI00369F1716